MKVAYNNSNKSRKNCSVEHDDRDGNGRMGLVEEGCTDVWP